MINHPCLIEPAVKPVEVMVGVAPADEAVTPAMGSTTPKETSSPAAMTAAEELTARPFLRHDLMATGLPNGDAAS
jgi:hypothetical protein